MKVPPQRTDDGEGGVVRLIPSLMVAYHNHKAVMPAPSYFK
jgi:hypothetical protein